MIDLVHEEELIAHLTSLGFEELLRKLDDESPAELTERYADLADRYMVLCGKGQRSPEEQVDLDRIETGLSIVLGEFGLMTLAGRLTKIAQIARETAVIFNRSVLTPDVLVDAQLKMGLLAHLSDAKKLKGPVPVRAEKLVELAIRASRTAAALMELMSDRGTLTNLWTRKKLARQATARLVDELVAADAGAEVWVAAQTLLAAAGPSAQRQIDVLIVCHQISGLLGCAQMIKIASTLFGDIATLIREGIGA